MEVNAEKGIKIGAKVGLEVGAFFIAQPIGYLGMVIIVYDLFLKERLNRSFTEVEVEFLDRELVKLRERRAKMMRSHIDKVRRIGESKGGASSHLDAKTSEGDSASILEAVVDAEYDIRYLCLLRRFFKRMSKYDRERFSLLIKKHDPKAMNKDLQKKVVKSQRGDLAGMLDAYVNMRADDLEMKRQAIEMLCNIEGSAVTPYMFEEIQSEVEGAK